MSKCDYCHIVASTTSILGFELCRECSQSLSQKIPLGTLPQSAVIYVRVSTPKQNDEVAGLFIQIRQCIEYCFDNNIESRGIFQDVHSAWKMTPFRLVGLKNLFNYLGFDVYTPSKHPTKIRNVLFKKLDKAVNDSKSLLLMERQSMVKVDFIVVANIDRLGRDTRNMVAIKTQLAKIGTHIVSASQRLITSSDTGNFNFMRQALDAELFSMDRSIRGKSVKKSLAMLGHYMGGSAPYGKKVIKIGGIRKLVQDPGEQKIIKSIHQLITHGKSTPKILTYLKSHNIYKRGKPFTRGYILNLRKVGKMYDLTQMRDSLNEITF